MTFRTDLSTLDHKFRAKRSGMSPIEYAASVQHFRRPRRQVGPFIVTAVVLLGTLFMVRM